MVTHVKDTSNQLSTIAPGNTAGNTLIMTINGFNNPSAVANLTNITDTGGNKWRFSTAAHNVNPPVSGATDPNTGFYFFSAIAVCLNNDNGGSVQPCGTVTVAINNGLTNHRLYVSEWSGVPFPEVINAAVTDDVARSNPGGTYSLSVTPSAASGMAVAVTTSDNGFTGANAPFTFVNVNGGDQGWATFAAAGTQTCTFTAAGANGTAGGAMVAVGANPAAPALAGGRSQMKSRLLYADL